MAKSCFFHDGEAIKTVIRNADAKLYELLTAKDVSKTVALRTAIMLPRCCDGAIAGSTALMNGEGSNQKERELLEMAAANVLYLAADAYKMAVTTSTRVSRKGKPIRAIGKKAKLRCDDGKEVVLTVAYATRDDSAIDGVLLDEVLAELKRDIELGIELAPDEEELEFLDEIGGIVGDFFADLQSAAETDDGAKGEAMFNDAFIRAAGKLSEAVGKIE
ncbi:MAG: hypothetical protein LBM97_01555 [Candidatus Nomurabacteria bacterium]|nr:hypothetical protein [Candidatus Nomurabacteria bacterium]